MKRFAGRLVFSLLAVLASILPVALPMTTSSSALAAASPAPSASVGPCPSGSVQLSVPFDHTANGNCLAPGSSGVIVAYLVLVLKLLAGAVGAVVVLMLIIAGIQYVTSTGDPTQVKAAKERITNAITALVLFLFMFAILNFLIPGGVFH